MRLLVSFKYHFLTKFFAENDVKQSRPNDYKATMLMLQVADPSDINHLYSSDPEMNIKDES